MSCTSPSRRATTIGSGSSSSAFNRSIECGVAGGEAAAGRRRSDATFAASASPRPRLAQLGGDGVGLLVVVAGDVDAVDDQPAEGHPRLAQLAAEEDRLGDGLALGGGDDEKRRRGVGEQRLDAGGALLEAVHQAAQRAEEDRDVVHEVDAGQRA